MHLKPSRRGIGRRPQRAEAQRLSPPDRRIDTIAERKENLSLPDVIGVASGVLSFVVFVGSIVVFMVRRAKVPDQELWYEVISRPILNGPAPSSVQVVVDQRVVEEPFAVAIHIWSTGAADIPTFAFDDRQPISFTFDRDLLGPVTGTISSGSTVEGNHPSTRTITVGPGLVRKRFQGVWSFVTDGRLTVDVSDPFANVSFQSAAKAERKHDRWSRILSAVGLVLFLVPLVVVIVIAVVAGANPSFKNELELWIAPIVLLTAAGAVILAAVGAYPSRWSRALAKAGRSRWDKYRGSDPFTPDPEPNYYSD